MNRRHFISVSLAALATVSISGCHPYRREPYEPDYHGPPPWAPAHGYRHKHRSGVDLVYDAGLGVYIVVGWPNHYFYDGHFYRHRQGHWEESREFNDHWHRPPSGRVPPGLKGRGRGGRGHGSGRSPGNS